MRRLCCCDPEFTAHVETVSKAPVINIHACACAHADVGVHFEDVVPLTLELALEN